MDIFDFHVHHGNACEPDFNRAVNIHLLKERRLNFHFKKIDVLCESERTLIIAAGGKF